MNGLMMQQPLLISSLLTHAERHHGEQRDRVAPRRGRPAPHHLPRARRALAPHGQRAAPRCGVEVRRPRRHAGVERLPPHGAVLRGVGLGRRAAHAQPAPASRPGRLDRRPCRRPGPVLRPDLPAADRGDRLAREDDQGLRRDDRPRAHAGASSKVPEPAVLRGADRRRERRASRGPSSTRTRPRRCCYTSGTTGNPKGALYSHRSTLLHTYAAALPDALELLGARRDPAGGADVPRQRLGPALRRPAWSAPSSSSRARGSTASRCTTCSRAKASPSRPACRPSGRACSATSKPTT